MTPPRAVVIMAGPSIARKRLAHKRKRRAEPARGALDRPGCSGRGIDREREGGRP